MSTEAVDNTPDVSEDVDLDSFSSSFFGQKDTTPEPTNSDEDVEEGTTEDDATFEETVDEVEENPEEEALDEDTEDETEEEDSTPEPPKKRNRFQERIDELTGKAKSAERRAEDLESRLEALMAKLDKEDTPEPEPKPVAKAAPDSDGRPDPYAKNEDGSDMYPLGEYDPQFTLDLTDWRMDQREAQRAEKNAKQTQEQEDARARQALAQDWQEKLAPAQERYPDFEQKGENLSPVFEKLDSAYTEYLAATVMAMDHGPDVLYYLAENTNEAAQIFAMGPQKATIALGRIESRFLQETPPKRRVSKAPTPPPTNKGSDASKGRVKPDTDDLDAFAKSFFKA